MSEIGLKIREAPETDYIHTLNGQFVVLKEIFDQCAGKWPDCNLFSKFYHWKNETKWIVSQTEDGPVKHKIRIYYNPLSVCHPERVSPGRTHGDVAEFYDAKGVFMGIAVYMGQKQYFSIPYSGYKKLAP